VYDRVRHRQESSTRAHRFDLCVPVWFKAGNETEWRAGITQNVSASGALIRADSPVVPTEPVVVAIALPAVNGCLVGRGHIVRTVEPLERPALAAFAIAVRRYRIDRYESFLRGFTR
jgi:hypothetical protein